MDDDVKESLVDLAHRWCEDAIRQADESPTAIRQADESPTAKKPSAALLPLLCRSLYGFRANEVGTLQVLFKGHWLDCDLTLPVRSVALQCSRSADFAVLHTTERAFVVDIVHGSVAELGSAFGAGARVLRHTVCSFLVVRADGHCCVLVVTPSSIDCYEVAGTLPPASFYALDASEVLTITQTGSGLKVGFYRLCADIDTVNDSERCVRLGTMRLVAQCVIECAWQVPGRAVTVTDVGGGDGVILVIEDKENGLWQACELILSDGKLTLTVGLELRKPMVLANSYPRTIVAGVEPTVLV
jgi:hypothetical protein